MTNFSGCLQKPGAWRRARLVGVGAVSALVVALAACGGGGGGTAGSGGGDNGGGGPGNPGNPTAGWSDPVRLPGVLASEPVVAIDATDRATAVWLQREAGTGENHVWASRSTAGAAWSAPVRLDANAGNVTQLRLAIHRDSGFGMLLWTQTGATQDLHARALHPVNGWGPEARVDTLAGTVGVSSVGVDSAGNAVAVWSQIGPATRFSVYGSRYVAASGWSAPQLVETNEVVGSQDGDPIVRVFPNGDAVTVWKRSGAGAGDGLWSNQSGPATGWGSPTQVVADAGPLQSIGKHDRAWDPSSATVAPAVPNSRGYISAPVLRTNAAAGAVLAWVEADNALKAALAPAGGAFGGVQTLRTANAGTWLGQPALGIDDSSAAWAAWADPVSADAMVALHTLPPGWSQAAPNETYPDPSRPPALDTNGRGNAVMVWAQSFATGDQIVLRRYTSGR
ncbi:MAG: hypothetical protein MUE35_09455 [Hydrogenophaga sp.]|nr:hypothetical protein [Hydrogenophaga sp.]